MFYLYLSILSVYLSIYLWFSNEELQSTLHMFMELEMDVKDTGSNPFSSLKPEQLPKSPNKAPIYANAHYVSFRGLLEVKEEEEQN